MKPLESALESDVVALVNDIGGRALKLRIDGENGFPDRTILVPDGRSPLFLELKRERVGRASRQQQIYRDVLREMGYAAEITDNLSDAERIIRTWLKETN